MKITKATMADVAKKAGVSAATVARVIYSNGYVKQQTRDVVEAAVADTGYRPNVMARGLRTSRSFTLGLVVSESRLNAFHPYIAHQVQLEALARGYSVLTLNNNGRPDFEDAGIQRFLDHHVDAIIFCAAIDRQNVHASLKAGIPTVQIERQIASAGSFVLVDPSAGVLQAVEHLVQLGHSRIAYIGGDFNQNRSDRPASSSVEALRLDSVKSALADNGVMLPGEYVRLGSYYPEPGNALHPGYLHMLALLDLPLRPTAVICGSDLLAASALQALHEYDLVVPRDMSMIGFDDSMAEILTPPLSSIAQPILELGRQAVELAIAAIEEPSAEAKTVTLETELVLRRSTGPAPT